MSTKESVEGLLTKIGARISVARRMRDWSQPTLASHAGIGLSTMAAIEKGRGTVQIDSYLKVLQALDLLGSAEDIAAPRHDPIAENVLAELLPKRASRGR